HARWFSPLDQLVVASSRHKAELLALPLGGARKCQVDCLSADGRLVEFAERKQKAFEGLAREHVQEVALVLAPVDGAQQVEPTLRAPQSGVVTGSDVARTQPICQGDELPHFHPAIAAHAGARRLSLQVALDKWSHDFALEELPA